MPVMLRPDACANKKRSGCRKGAWSASAWSRGVGCIDEQSMRAACIVPSTELAAVLNVQTGRAVDVLPEEHRTEEFRGGRLNLHARACNGCSGWHAAGIQLSPLPVFPSRSSAFPGALWLVWVVASVVGQPRGRRDRTTIGSRTWHSHHRHPHRARALAQTCTHRMASAMAELAIKVIQQTTTSSRFRPRSPTLAFVHRTYPPPNKKKTNGKGISPRFCPQRMTTLHRKERRSQMRRPVKLHTTRPSHGAAYKASMPRKASAPAMLAPMAAEGIDAAPGASVGCGLPVLESVGVFTLVTPVEFVPIEETPVPEGTTTGADVTMTDVTTAVLVSTTEDTSYDEDGAAVADGAGVATG
jgi:hypothetical protein